MNIESILPFLSELLVKSAAILLAAALIVRLWRGATAAQRHLVWLAGLVIVLLLPMTRFVTPRWSVPLEQPTKISVPMTAFKLAPVEDTVVTGYSVASAPRHTSWTFPDWRKVLLGAWLGGVFLLFGYRLVGSRRLSRLENRSVLLSDARVREMMSSVRRELKIERDVNIRVSEECRVPMTWGVLRPVLMLPSEALSWSDARIMAALRHEAGHIGRQDYLVRWLAQAACALYWPNPLVWIAARALRVAQEQATDDLVLRAGTAPDEYAAQLFDAARTVAERGFFAQHAVAMASPSTLERRMLAIVDERRDRRPLSRGAVIVGSVMIVLTLAISTAAQLQGADREPSPAAGTSEPAAAKPKELQVEIQARFVEMPLESDAAFWWNQFETVPQGGQTGGVFSDPQFQVVIRALSQKKGVDLMSAPRVTTKAKQQAVVEVIREFRYPTEFDKGAEGIWKPTEFGVKNVGVTLDVRSDIKADGSIELVLKPSVVEFLGFVDLDTGKSVAATRDKSKPGAVPDLTPIEPVSRLKPIFSERKIETTVTLQDGYTVALSGIKETVELKPFEKNRPERKLIVFVSARIIDATGKKESADAPPASAAAEKAAKIIIPKLEFRDAGLRECVALLQQKSRDHSPDRQGVNLVFNLPAGDEPKITLSLTNISLLEAVKNVAQLSGVSFAAEPDALVLGTAAEANPAPAESAVLAKARKIILPKVELREATLAEAVDFLRQKAREFDEEKEGVNLILRLGSPAGSPPSNLPPENARITMTLTNLPLIEAVHYVAGLANLQFVAEGNALVLVPSNMAKPAPEKMKGPAHVLVPPAGSAAYDKALKIIFPKIELRAATVAEAVDLLRQKAREFDEEKQGVKLILKPGPDANARLSLSLTNIPLSEAVRYVADLAGLEVRAEPDALVLQPYAGGHLTREWRISGEILRRAFGTDESTESVKAALIDRHVTFPEGSTLAWLPEKERLVARNTAENLQRLESLIEKAVGEQER